MTWILTGWRCCFYQYNHEGSRLQLRAECHCERSHSIMLAVNCLQIIFILDNTLDLSNCANCEVNVKSYSSCCHFNTQLFLFAAVRTSQLSACREMYSVRIWEEGLVSRVFVMMYFIIPAELSAHLYCLCAAHGGWLSSAVSADLLGPPPGLSHNWDN